MCLFFFLPSCCVCACVPVFFLFFRILLQECRQGHPDLAFSFIYLCTYVRLYAYLCCFVICLLCVFPKQSLFSHFNRRCCVVTFFQQHVRMLRMHIVVIFFAFLHHSLSFSHSHLIPIYSYSYCFDFFFLFALHKQKLNLCRLLASFTHSTPHHTASYKPHLTRSRYILYLFVLQTTCYLFVL